MNGTKEKWIVLTEQQEPLIYPIQQIDKIPLNLRQPPQHSYRSAHHYASNPPVIDKLQKHIDNIPFSNICTWRRPKTAFLNVKQHY